MTHTIEDFFKYEISEMHKNIDRIHHGLSRRDLSNPIIEGQCELLAIQEEHLSFLERMAQSVHTYDEAISQCHNVIMNNEQIHRELSRQELSVNHSSEWWHSLHQIQFGTDILHRIETWKQDYSY